MNMKTLELALTEIYRCSDTAFEARHIYNATREYILMLSEDVSLLEANLKAYDSALALFGKTNSRYLLYINRKPAEIFYSRATRRELVLHYATIYGDATVKPVEWGD